MLVPPSFQHVSQIRLVVQSVEAALQQEKDEDDLDYMVLEVQPMVIQSYAGEDHCDQVPFQRMLQGLKLECLREVLQA